MKSVVKSLLPVSLILLSLLSAADAQIDLSITAPVISARGDIYPDYPVCALPATDFVPPIPLGSLLSISVRASDFPQVALGNYDFYLILKSADTGKTYYAEFDIMKFLIGSFSLSEAISFGEAPAPFLSDLPINTDVDATIPVRLQDLDLTKGNYHVITVFTRAGTDEPVGNRAIDKIRVLQPYAVGCPPLR